MSSRRFGRPSRTLWVHHYGTRCTGRPYGGCRTLSRTGSPSCPWWCPCSLGHDWWSQNLLGINRIESTMGLLPDTENCGLRMCRECRERFPRHRLQRKLLVSDPGMHHYTCVTHVPWCMSGPLTRGGGENVPGIPGACATRDFTYLVRG